MVTKIQDEINISPWDALLFSVRRAAARVAWVDQKLAEAVDHQSRDNSRRNSVGVEDNVRGWLKASREERKFLASVSKGAIDAGVAERMVRNVEAEVSTTVKAVIAAVDALGLTGADRVKALKAAKERLLADDTGDIIEGKVLLVTDVPEEREKVSRGQKRRRQ